MLQNPIRACDHCHGAIEPQTNYLSIKCAVHLDMPGIPNVTADSTRIDSERRVDLHPTCASDFFKVDGWVPNALQLPPLTAPSPDLPMDFTPTGYELAQQAKAKQLAGKPEATKKALSAKKPSAGRAPKP